MHLIVTVYNNNTNNHTNKNINNSRINKQDANAVIATTEDDMSALAEQTKQLNQDIMILLQKHSSQWSNNHNHIHNNTIRSNTTAARSVILLEPMALEGIVSEYIQLQQQQDHLNSTATSYIEMMNLVCIACAQDCTFLEEMITTWHECIEINSPWMWKEFSLVLWQQDPHNIPIMTTMMTTSTTRHTLWLLCSNGSAVVQLYSHNIQVNERNILGSCNGLCHSENVVVYCFLP